MLRDPLYVVPDSVETRWASGENPKGERGKGGQLNAGRKGRPCVSIKAGESYVMAEAEGAPGCVRRIWVTINDRSPQMLRGLRLDFYWDGAKRPAVSAPFGDFFGTGLGRMARFQCALFSNPEGRSFNCVIPMPFRTGMRMVATNESGRDLGAFFYDVDYTVGDALPEEAAYFHAHWRRENPTTVQQDYEILPRVQGRGRFLGANVGVIADMKLYTTTWWGEGEVKVYLDGDAKYPTLCGTGTEDYIGTGWGQGQYATMFQGCHVADHKKMQYCFYRYHVPDPIYFHRDARVTIQQIGYLSEDQYPYLHFAGRTLHKATAGMEDIDVAPGEGRSRYAMFERQDDWSSCAYFYVDRPANDLPELAPVAERTAGLPENPPVAEN